MKLSCPEKGKIVVNGKEYSGNLIEVKKDGVYVDGEQQSTSDGSLKFNISVYGDVDLIKSGAGNIHVSCADNIGSISSECGDIKCGNVKGSIITQHGDIECANIVGNVSTELGEINCGDVMSAYSKHGNIVSSR